MPIYSITAQSRFWSKVNKTKDCWIWTTGKTHTGYGAFSVGKKFILAHRFSFELINGDIHGKILDHLCRNPLCVRPEHLEIVSPAENARRGLVSKLNTNDVLEIRKLYPNVVQTKLAKIYKVGQEEISRIINKRRWANI